MSIRRPPAGRVARTIAVAGLLAILWPLLADAIMVAPHAVFIDHRTRSGQLQLVNTGAVPEEVEIVLRYGYPDADSAGDPMIRFIDEPGPDEPAATPWIRALPRRTVVAPGERQTVRLFASPPEGLPDGEYWSRVMVISRAIQDPSAAGDSAVSAGVRVELRTVLALSYRKGRLSTGIAIAEFRPAISGDSLVVWMRLERSGNAAYLGTAGFEMRDLAGTRQREWSTQIAVYKPVLRRFAFPLDRLVPGGYTVHVRLGTERADLAAANVLPAPVVRDSAVVTVR